MGVCTRKGFQCALVVLTNYLTPIKRRREELHTANIHSYLVSVGRLSIKTVTIEWNYKELPWE